MARYEAGVRTAAGSTTLPIFSLYAIAAIGGAIREIGIFNTTATAVALQLRRFSTAGTKPAATADIEHWQDQNAASCTFHGTHTVAPTLVAGLGRRAVLGGVIGSGIVWTFGDAGLVIPPGTANGVGILVSTGTGQICDAYMVWDE